MMTLGKSARYNPGPILNSAQSAPREAGLGSLNVLTVFQGAASRPKASLVLMQD